MSSCSFKLNPARFDFRSYITNRYQHHKINNSFCQWKRVLAGVPQGPILGPLLSDIFMNIFLLLQTCKLANYADDSTMNSSGKNKNNIMTPLNYDFAILSNWFYKTLWSSILINAPLCYLALRMNFKQISHLTALLLNSKEEKILGITFDNKLEQKTFSLIKDILFHKVSI